MNREEIIKKINDTYENSLNKEQKNAVDAIIEPWSAGEDFIFPIVDGPPGTGKTFIGVLAAAKYYLENPKEKIAYLCYTNFATDWAWKKLLEVGLTSQEVIRLHHDSRLTDLTKGIVGGRSNLKDLSRRERENVENSGILLSTLHGCGRPFEVQNKPKIIIDEFSQVSPPMFFSAIRKAFKKNPSGYALLGDPIQLPVITTQPLLTPNIGVYIMQRKIYRPHELVWQHRMHENICEIVNSIRKYSFNTYKLKTAENIKEKSLIELGFQWEKKNTPVDLHEILDPSYPVVLINTDKLGTERKVLKSICNTGEAELVINIAKAIHDSYKDNKGKKLVPVILSPYTAQIGELRQNLPKELQWYNEGEPACTTIYRSQGREYPCIIISFVRNNPGGFIGFLDKYELKAQTYVACSRAKAKLILLFSFETFLGHNHRDFEAIYSNDVLKIDAPGRLK